MAHKLITATDRTRLEKNWKRRLRDESLMTQLEQSGVEYSPAYNALDEEPVVKLFDFLGEAFWLLVEMEPDTDDDLAFGLCDLGLGFPELGYVSVSELNEIKITAGRTQCRRIERDLWWKAEKTLGEYLADAKIGVRP